LPLAIRSIPPRRSMASSTARPILSFLMRTTLTTGFAAPVASRQTSQRQPGRASKAGILSVQLHILFLRCPAHKSSPPLSVPRRHSPGKWYSPSRTPDSFPPSPPPRVAGRTPALSRYRVTSNKRIPGSGLPPRARCSADAAPRSAGAPSNANQRRSSSARNPPRGSGHKHHDHRVPR